MFYLALPYSKNSILLLMPLVNGSSRIKVPGISRSFVSKGLILPPPGREPAHEYGDAWGNVLGNRLNTDAPSSRACLRSSIKSVVPHNQRIVLHYCPSRVAPAAAPGARARHRAAACVPSS